MVTRKLIRVTSPEAAALAAKDSSLSSAAAEDSTAVNKQPTTHLTHDIGNKSDGGKKRDVPSEGAIISGREVKKRQRFAMDLGDVPPQQPILKGGGRIKQGSSKYTGVSFHKASNKWQAAIMIDRKLRHIGYYVNEEEAAIDYAKAAFKYKGQEARERKQKKSATATDLSDVPPQQPIPKSKGRMKEGASKYTGVYFNKASNKWMAQITIDGKQLAIGCYENEEEAATDYARAVFKYRSQEALEKEGKQNKFALPAIDLSDVPPQLPIPKSAGHIKEGSSKYSGINFDKPRNKWLTRIKIEGKQRHIGYYENEEEAAVDYARAVFKYKGKNALVKESTSSAPAIVLSDIPLQPPILRRCTKEGSSKYVGVTFDKRSNKWQARIMIEAKEHHIGYYEKEEEAAIDYARAVFKHKGENALGEARERNKFALPAINLSDVPPQRPILKNEHHIKVRSSKYTGVSFHKKKNKWKADIRIDGKQRHIGYYEEEEKAAIDYARAVLKYKGQVELDKARERNDSGSIPAINIDLSDVPSLSPIPKPEAQIKEGSSKYKGVSFHKTNNKWIAQIRIEGKQKCIGYYENEEEAAVDYARAVFKYQGRDTLGTSEQKSDMNDSSSATTSTQK